MAETEQKQQSKQDPTRLDEGQIAAIMEWLKGRWKNSRCPICDNTSWDMAQHMIVGNVFHKGGMTFGGGRAYPLVMVFCKNCGFAHSFSAVKIDGLLKEKEKADG